MAKATKKSPTGLQSKSTAVSRVYKDETIEAVKSFAFVAKRDFGTCSLSGKKISKGDKCEMLILPDGTKVTTLLSTTVAKGNKAKKVQSTSKKENPLQGFKNVDEFVRASFKEAYAKDKTYSQDVVKAVVKVMKAKTQADKYKVLMTLPINIVGEVIELTK